MTEKGITIRLPLPHTHEKQPTSGDFIKALWEQDKKDDSLELQRDIEIADIVRKVGEQ